MATDPAQSAAQAQSLSSQYEALSNFHNTPVDTDPSFLSGLATILGHPETPVTAEEVAAQPDLVLQAKCFYFTRMSGVQITPQDYLAWLHQDFEEDEQQQAQQKQEQQQAQPTADDTTDSTHPSPQHTTTYPPPPPQNTAVPTPTEPPPYPTSFEHIVALITSNQSIPGIEEIPNTVLDRNLSKADNTARRKKPWENTGNNGEHSNDTTTDGQVLGEDSLQSALKQEGGPSDYLAYLKKLGDAKKEEEEEQRHEIGGDDLG